VFRGFRIPVGPWQLVRSTGAEILKDDVLGMAGQLAYFFVLALFPALIFFVSLVAYLPGDLAQQLVTSVQPFLPEAAVTVMQEQVAKLTAGDPKGILTVGLLVAIWSSSSGLIAVVSTLNRAYDITDARPWWKVRGLAILLTLALTVVVILGLTLVMAGPAIARLIGDAVGFGPAFVSAWSIGRWPVIFLIVSLAMALIYYYAPDADQDWIWITPGSILATLLWIGASLGLRAYLDLAGNFNETYGTLGGAMAVLLWLYLTGVAILIGGEVNAEIEHASPEGKDPGEKVPGQRRRLRAFARRLQARRSEVTHEGTQPPAS